MFHYKPSSYWSIPTETPILDPFPKELWRFTKALARAAGTGQANPLQPQRKGPQHSCRSPISCARPASNSDSGYGISASSVCGFALIGVIPIYPYPKVQTENFGTFETTSPNFSCFADSRPKGHVTRFARRACWGMCQSCRSRSKDGHICTCCACHRDSCLSRWLPCYCPWIANIMQNQRLQPINLSSKTMINLYILLECAIDDERRISEQIGTTVRCFPAFSKRL